MTRLKDWPSRFAALVASARARPFAWGSHDCCLWAADAVLALTGEDPAAKLRGSYADEAGALALVARLGGLPAIAARGGVEIHVNLATQGDVGMVRWVDGTISLAVHSGTGWLVAAECGMVRLPQAAGLRAWGVGRV